MNLRSILRRDGRVRAAFLSRHGLGKLGAMRTVLDLRQNCLFSPPQGELSARIRRKFLRGMRKSRVAAKDLQAVAARAPPAGAIDLPARQIYVSRLRVFASKWIR